MDFGERSNLVMEAINGFLWADWVLYVILATGVLFLILNKFSPLTSLTHGIQVVRGKYDHNTDPGAITHFQALSAALSATVGLGNIGGVAVAISLGGPGAVFWMWIVGIIGMALKAHEVNLSMLYRDASDEKGPLGGPMHVAEKGMKEVYPRFSSIGRALGILFCITLLISAVTGGNMFQAWNVAELNKKYFSIPTIYSGIVLAVITGLVIIGGIKRIGAVAGKLVPFMCAIYLLSAFYVLFQYIDTIPSMLALIVRSAFNPLESQGAFIGGTVGYAFLWGMKRALFSNEAGQGSAPIAHAAAKTDEPVREGIVAGLEPFIDTIVVCTITALVILCSGAWNRPADAQLTAAPVISEVEVGQYSLTHSLLPDTKTVGTESVEWSNGDKVFVLAETHINEQTGTNLQKIYGDIKQDETTGSYIVDWEPLFTKTNPIISDLGVYSVYAGATLTSHAFDLTYYGLGGYVVTLVAFLFAISTMISWSYYGEQGIIYMFGNRAILPYKIIYCLLIILACSGFLTTDRELDNLTGIGTGVMLFVNIPICLLFARKGVRAYHGYMKRLKAGEFSS